MRTWTAWSFALVIGNAANVAAQELKPVVFGAAGVANVYRTEDRNFGTELNVGGGAGIEWKRLGLDVEVHRTSGLTPRPIQCGIVNVPCVGSAREGFRVNAPTAGSSATAAARRTTAVPQRHSQGTERDGSKPARRTRGVRNRSGGGISCRTTASTGDGAKDGATRHDTAAPSSRRSRLRISRAHPRLGRRHRSALHAPPPNSRRHRRRCPSLVRLRRD